MTVDLRHLVYALSDALDLVGVDDIGHGKRVGIMAAECARKLGMNQKQTTFMFDLGLLHDIGVSSTETHHSLVSEFDWNDSQMHCEDGYQRVRNFSLLSRMALPIRYHHTRWEQLSARSDIDRTVAIQANLIYLVDRVDALAAPYYADRSLSMKAEWIREQIGQRARTYFAPELVEAFLDASASDFFWLQLEPRSIQVILQDMLARHNPYQASMAELKELAEVFSRIVDAKSPFTASHSLGVARLSRFIAQNMGVSAQNCDKIEVAGLLHDLGKLRVPDSILEKPGKLDERERLIMNAHSFETFQILRNIKGFEEIAPWAAYHHEEPDGSGYPFGLHNMELPLEARILRIADIFQAMVQNRPYRKGLSADEVVDFLNDWADRGRVEADIVKVCTEDIHAAMSAALPDNARFVYH